MRTPEIRTENDYDKFSFAYFNREIKSITVKKLKDEFKRENNFPFFPIVVDDNMRIIDGQHRFKACKELGEPIYYIKKNVSVTPTDIRTVNKAGKTHTINDIFEMELKVGNSEVFAAREIHRYFDFKFNLSSLLACCMQNTSGSALKHALEDGTFRIKDKKHVMEVMEKLVNLCEGKIVPTYLHNVTYLLAKKNDISQIALIDEVANKGLVVSNRMSKTMVINKLVDTYNYKKTQKNRIEA